MAATKGFRVDQCCAVRVPRLRGGENGPVTILCQIMIAEKETRGHCVKDARRVILGATLEKSVIEF